MDVCFGIDGDPSSSHDEAIPIDFILCCFILLLDFRRGVVFSDASEQSDLSESENPESWLLRSWLKGLHDLFPVAILRSSCPSISSILQY